MERMVVKSEESIDWAEAQIELMPIRNNRELFHLKYGKNILKEFRVVRFTGNHSLNKI